MGHYRGAGPLEYGALENPGDVPDGGYILLQGHAWTLAHGGVGEVEVEGEGRGEVEGPRRDWKR